MTFLASAFWYSRINFIVSTNIITYLKKQNEQVFYFYFDTLDATKSKVVYQGLNSSLLANIGTHPGYAPSVLQDLYKNSQNGSEKISADVMKTAILNILRSSTAKTYIILDAMDECQELMKVNMMIQALLDLQPKIYILVTSRHSMSYTLSGSFKMIQISLNIEERTDDIIMHVEQGIRENSSQFKGLEEEIKATLIGGAHGQ